MVTSMGRTVLTCLMALLMPVLGWANDVPQFTPGEKAWIAAHPVVRTFTDTRWRPFEFRENGQVVGMIPSYLDAISRISGLHFEYVDNVSWANEYTALADGIIDIAPDVGTNRIGRRNGHDFIVSQPYFVGTMLVVTSRRLNQRFTDLRSLAGKRVAIKGGGGLENAMRQSGVPLKLQTFDDEHNALAAVAHGDADVAVGPDMSIVPLIHRQFQNELFVSGGLLDHQYALGMATRADMPELASIVAKSLAAIPAREVGLIMHEWAESADYGKPTIQSILYYRRWQVTAAGATLLALAAIAFASWRARVAAIRSERDKAMFVAFISHEIRTPMHTILSSLELLQRSNLAPKQAGRANAALAASESLLTLLDDLLEYSRLESHNVTLAPEPTHVEPWARRSADMLRWRIDEKGLNLALELVCPPGLCVLIDPVRTRQIVLNLLVNAIKFTSAGSIALRIDYLDSRPGRSGSLVIEVRDTGIGIPPEAQRNIFEPYQRVEAPKGRSVSGSGLGLSICSELVDLMKGAITVSSSPDKGTVFTVILPVRRATRALASGSNPPQAPMPQPQLRTDTPLEADTPPRTGEGAMILVVDDHEAVQHAITHQFEALACRSAVAGTGERALDQFERTRFDMVLLDCDLPDIDGYTVARRMRNSEQRRMQKRTPIIAISASTGDAHRERCFTSGMDGVLGKPLRLDALRQMIDLWCPGVEAGTAMPPAETLAPEKPDFRAIYRQSVDADLAELGAALSNGDADRARRAAHRVKGAAAIAGHIATSELAADLEHRLLTVSDGMPPDAAALHDELLRLHRADTAAPD
ncbi:transporter substrate-binding domain-containing protein [Burkholderia sp. Se-20378]|nr:transporter substrate-binding domain-containing protein [Burkholderia sp. Se-20378]